MTDPGSATNKLTELVRRHRPALVCCAIYLAASLLAWPFGDFPLNDDWSYAKSVLRLVNEGRLDMGLSSSSLLTQIGWGALFVKLFGFSFTVLRASTWLAVLITIFTLSDLLRRVNISEKLRMACCLVLLFNPVYFSLSHTFMTDVNFICLLVLCVHQAICFWQEKKAGYLVSFFIASLLLVFLRQFGVIVPIAFCMSCLLLEERRAFWTIVAALACVALVVLLYLFEQELGKRGVVAYQAASRYDPLSAGFWSRTGLNLGERYRMLIAQTLVYTLPLFAGLIFPLAKASRKRNVVLTLILSGVLTLALFDREAFPLGNIFTNLSLGAETFYESLKWEVRAPFPHTYSETAGLVIHLLQLLALFMGLWVAGLLVIRALSRPWRVNPAQLFLLISGAGYVFFLCVSEMYFDRYHLPLLILVMMLLMVTHVRMQLSPLFFMLVIMACVSVAGTHDYFVLNRQRWKAYDFLRQESGVPIDKINGGNEVHNWHEGESVKWDSYLDLATYDYLIQYRAEPGFSPLREYPVVRWLPPRADKIYIFGRNKIPEKTR